jgi:hypothetical protein
MHRSRGRYGTVPIYMDANKAYPTFQTVSLLLTFFLAMLMNPDAQTKAQEEIDRVIGTDRLPTFDDESKLPYVSALSKEVFRWQQVAPFGMSSYSLHISILLVNFLPCFSAIPHRLMEDDVYNGYFLPKDSIVLGNAWCARALSLCSTHEIDGIFPSRAILHDDRLFPDPFTFKPERFIGPDVDPRVHPAVDYAFGFGRRVCPGRWMAHAFVWVVVASVLSAFRIEKAVRDGRVIEPTGAFTPGILSCVVLCFAWPWMFA